MMAIRQKDLIGKRARMNRTIENGRGDVIASGEEVTIGSSYRKWRYGVTADDGKRHIIKVHVRDLTVLEDR